MTLHHFSFPTEIVFGPRARHELAGVLTRQGVERPLVVTDRGVHKLGFFSELHDELEASDGLTPGVFADFEGNPLEQHVTDGVSAYEAHEADAIVALGGGAALDVAKAIALMVHHPGELFDYEDGRPDARPVDQPIPFLVAMPTTSGTGSEVGRSTVVSENETHAKKIIFDARLMPPVVLADPELTFDLPPKLTAATGMDAVTHNVEAYLAVGYHPMCDGIALEALRRISEHLTQACTNPADLEARSEMMLASLMGAVAFQKGLGVTHSLAHALSTVCDLHHGLANAVMLPHAMSFNAESAPERFEELAHAVGAASEDATGFLQWLDDLLDELEIPRHLGDLGVEESHLDELVRFARADVCHQSNPRPATEEDFRQLYENAL